MSKDIKGPTILRSSFSKELWSHRAELAIPPEDEHFKYLCALRATGDRENSTLPEVAHLGINHGNHRSGAASLGCEKLLKQRLKDGEFHTETKWKLGGEWVSNAKGLLTENVDFKLDFSATSIINVIEEDT